MTVIVSLALSQVCGETSIIEVTRTLAQANTSTKAQFDVDSYGADPTGKTDSTAAIQKAIQTAIASGQPATLVFSAGTYLLDSKSSNWCLDISKSHSLSIIGQGIDVTTLLIKNPHVGLANIKTSTNFEISNLSIDYYTLPFSQGKIVQIGNGTIDVAIANGFQFLSSSTFITNVNNSIVGSHFLPGQPLLKANVLNYYPIQGITKLSNNSFRIGNINTSNMAIGDQFSVHVRNPSHALKFHMNTDININNIAIYAAPGAATVWIQNSGRIVIDGLEVRRKPNTNRLMSTAADAIHMQNNEGQFILQNSYIEGMGDDALNIYNRGFFVTSVQSSQIVQIDTQSSNLNLKPDQEIQFVNATSQIPISIGRIRSVQRNSPRLITVTLDRPIGNVRVGDVAFDKQFAMPFAIIRNNIFSNFRGMFRIRSEGAIFINNKILDKRNANIFISADIGSMWQEGPSLISFFSPVVFSGNTVSGGSLTLTGINHASLGSPLSSVNELKSHPLVFSPTNYKLLNPDLSGFTNAQLKTHWLQHGITEGRRASIYFSSRQYLNLYKDLRQAFGAKNFNAAILHYINYGFAIEGRYGAIDTHPLVYNLIDYINYNPDLNIMKNSSIELHWLLNGIDEGRRASVNFHSRKYLNRYSDLSAAYGFSNYFQAIWHFVIYGYNAGRIGN